GGGYGLPLFLLWRLLIRGRHVGAGEGARKLDYNANCSRLIEILNDPRGPASGFDSPAALLDGHVSSL
ncbi:MAG: hypothetical protein SCG73_07690, partial [Nitrospiraceae bacterium]|nr:hypothetical protein [Nitrospiraceae bacterium]